MSRGRAWALRIHWMGMLLLGLLALPLLTFGLVPARESKATEAKKPWTGTLADGRKITQTDLDRILQAHALWVKGKDGQRADLSRASLREANLIGADLSWADLYNASLCDANLRRADLIGTNLEYADLRAANFEEATLYEANLRQADLRRANLSRAKLSKANLSGAVLQEANLDRATLKEANLTGTVLWKADLSYAWLHYANFSGADLRGANLSGANLWKANLDEADLRMANLSRASLDGATLSKAILEGADLTGANLFEANLNGAVFEPKPGSVSDVLLLLNIKGLASLRYVKSPHGLVELREAYKKAGLREEERQVTFALNHTRRVKLWERPGLLNKMESLFQMVCFEWPCQYGLNPGRPLEILGLGLFLFIPLYLLALRSRDPETGLWLVLPPDRIIGGGAKVRPFKLTGRTPFRPLPPGRWPRLKARLHRGLRRLRLAFYFSLLSAFNLGWRELNVGNWISRLQKNEYTLRATGWPRTVAGMQSLLSVYLLALWVLTYFGRPFD